MSWMERLTIGEPDECWPWLGAVTGSGYGHFYRDKVNYQVHREVYAIAHGPIPEGHDIHHTCGARNCHNPHHLEALSRSEHNLTKWPMVCPQGHDYPDPPLRVRGKRICRICKNAQQRDYARRLRLGTQKA